MPHSTRRRQKHSKLLNRLYPSYCSSGNGCSRTLGDVLRSWGISEVDKRGSTQEGTRKRRRVDESRSLEAVLRNNLVLNWRKPDVNPCCALPPGSPSSEQNQTFAALLDGVIMALHHEPKRHGGVGNVLCLGRQGQGGSELRHSRTWAELHSRAGDDCMRHLLLNHSIFTALENDCYLQVAGPSVPELASRKQKLTDQGGKQEKKYGQQQTNQGHYENLKLPWPSFVPASHILYSDSLRSIGGGLHRSHVFNRASPNEVGAIRLMKDIFIGPGRWQQYQATPSTSRKKKPMSRLLYNGIPLFEDILKRHRICQYGRLLSRYCPLPKGFSCNKRRKMNNNPNRSYWPSNTSMFLAATDDDCHVTQAEVQVSGEGENKSSGHCERVLPSSSSTCPVDATNEDVKRDVTELPSPTQPAPNSMPHLSTTSAFVPELAYEENAVASFLASVCRSLLPVELFGNSQNLTIVINTVKSLARLKRGECLHLNSLPQGLRVSAVEWLLTKSELGEEEESGSHKSGEVKRKRKRTCISSMRARERALLCLLRWIVFRLCVSILRANFYATEGEGFGHRILYFRGPVWIYLRRQGLSRMIRGPPFPWDEIQEGNGDMMKQEDTPCATKYQCVSMNSSKTIASLSCAATTAPAAASSTLAHHHVENMGLLPTNLPPSILRLLPKRCGGFRGLVTLSRGVNSDGKIEQRIKGGGANSKLRDLFHILKYEVSVQPEKVGFGVMGMDDIFARLKPYFCSWRENKCNTNCFSPSSLYLVSCDIAGCYDSIQLDRLINIVEESMSQESYIIQRLSCCTPHEALYRCFTRWPRKARPADHRESLRHRAYDIAKRSYGTIISENTSSKVHLNSRSSSNLPVDSELASKLLRQHLLNHQVIVPGERMRSQSGGGRPLILQQIRGIPQGSILSTLLCHMYIGKFENEVLRRALDQVDTETETTTTNSDSSLPLSDFSSSSFSSDSMLMRLVDDFLLVTPRRRVAISFLNAMSDLKKTSSPYGLTLKMEKTSVSFNLSEDEVKFVGGTARQYPKAAFPWCGLLLDGERGEVALDLSRLLAIPIRYSFSVPNTCTSPGVALRRKMKCFLGARMHLVLIDTGLNSQKRVLANAYGLLLLCAGKALSYAQQLNWRGCGAHIWDSRENTLVAAIVELASYAHSLMRSRTGGRLKGFSSVQQDIGSKHYVAASTCPVVARCNVKRSDVVWLTLAAFDTVVSSPNQKHHYQWDGLKRKLKRAMGGIQTADRRVFLKDIVDDPSARRLADEFVLG